MLPLLGDNTSIPSTWFLSYHWSLGNCSYYSLLQLNRPCIHRIILCTQHTAQVWMNISFFILLIFLHSLGIWYSSHLCTFGGRKWGIPPTESFPSLLLFCSIQWTWKHHCLTFPFAQCSPTSLWTSPSWSCALFWLIPCHSTVAAEKQCIQKVL